MTPYHYTHNNPLNRIDPDGRNDGLVTRIMHRENTDYLKGKITKSELSANRFWRGVGGLIGAAHFFTGPVGDR